MSTFLEKDSWGFCTLPAETKLKKYLHASIRFAHHLGQYAFPLAKTDSFSSPPLTYLNEFIIVKRLKHNFQPLLNFTLDVILFESLLDQ